MVEFLDSGEGGARGDAIDKNEAFAIADPLISKGSVFFLTGGIEDFKHAGLAIDDDLLSVRVFDGRIISLNKVV